MLKTPRPSWSARRSPSTSASAPRAPRGFKDTWAVQRQFQKELFTRETFKRRSYGLRYKRYTIWYMYEICMKYVWNIRSCFFNKWFVFYRLCVRTSILRWTDQPCTHWAAAVTGGWRVFDLGREGRLQEGARHLFQVKWSHLTSALKYILLELLEHD